MDPFPLTVDLDRLRAVANRVERSANALRRFRFTGIDDDALPGSAVGGAVAPELAASTLDDLIEVMLAWADAARRSAAAAEQADDVAAGRLGHR